MMCTYLCTKVLSPIPANYVIDLLHSLNPSLRNVESIAKF
jgi:hypothetical protein